MVTGLLIILPLLFSILVMLSGKEKNVRRIAFIASVAELVISLVALFRFKNNGLPEFSVSLVWIKNLGISFHFAMDGISLLLVLLTSFLFPVIILASSRCKSGRLNIFYGLIFIMETSLIGVFTAQDSIMFYIFWEFALIPAYFITAFWGGEDRIRITFKFFIYTLSGSILMLGALIYLYLQTPYPHSAEISAFYKLELSQTEQIWLFAAFFLAFAVKIPLIPFHTWQPDTYVTAPPAGSMILAGVMLKMGIYGVIRLLIPLCHDAIGITGLPVIIMITAGLIYASIIALNQTDLKRFVAYVSLAHAGLITAGALSSNQTALQGAVYQMISHGINVVGLFIIIEIIEARCGTRHINHLGGILRAIPGLGILMMIFVLGAIGLPLTNGFIGEFLILFGLFQYSPLIAVFAGTTIIFGAVYMLKMYQKVMLGTNIYYEKPELESLTVSEWGSLIPLALMVIITGCWPNPVLNLAGPAIKNLLSYIIIPN